MDNKKESTRKVLHKQADALKDEVKDIRKEMRKALKNNSSKKMHKASQRIVDTLFEIERCQEIQMECADRLRTMAKAALMR